MSKSSNSSLFPNSRTQIQSGTIASVLIDLLYQAGVRRIFGVAGDALNGLTDALRKDGRIAWIGCRHEENAAYAAYGEAEMTGGLGVCAGTVGPGALHLINGLYNAKREGASVLAITGQVPRRERGTGYFQEVDLGRVFSEVCAYEAILSSADQMARVSEIAIQKSLNEKCVTRIEIPIDLMTEEVPNPYVIHPLICSRPRLLPPRSEIDKAAQLIDSAQRITLFCGVGCRNATAEVVELSERIMAPIVHTLRAKDIFEGQHAHVLGLTGLLGAPPGYHATLDCDLLIILGSNFPYENFLPTDIPIIQVDVKIENLGRRAPTSLGLLGDISETLRELIPLLRGVRDTSFLKNLLVMKARFSR